MRKLFFNLRIFLLTALIIFSSFRPVECRYLTRFVSLWELCVTSTDIVKVVIDNVGTLYNDDEITEYWSVSAIVIHKYKGKLAVDEKIQVLSVKGYKDNIRISAGIRPVFTDKEYAILFLNDQHKFRELGNMNYLRNYSILSGLAQGKFRIIRNSLTQEEYIIREKVEKPLEIKIKNDYSWLKDEELRMRLSKKVNIPNKFLKLNNKIVVNDVDAFPLKDFIELIEIFVEAEKK
ncbi:MAG: hypothetical protein GY863_10135 [bacterium]|nr:hypothetical protein [bacterium]